MRHRPRRSAAPLAPVLPPADPFADVAGCATSHRLQLVRRGCGWSRDCCTGHTQGGVSQSAVVEVGRRTTRNPNRRAACTSPQHDAVQAPTPFRSHVQHRAPHPERALPTCGQLRGKGSGVGPCLRSQSRRHGVITATGVRRETRPRSRRSAPFHPPTTFRQRRWKPEAAATARFTLIDAVDAHTTSPRASGRLGGFRSGCGREL